MPQIAAIQARLKQLKEEDDRLSKVIDELIKITNEIYLLQSHAKESEVRIRHLEQRRTS